MGNYKEYVGKDGNEHKISIVDLKWIMDNSDLLDYEVLDFILAAEEEYSGKYEICPSSIFYFLLFNDDIPEIEIATKLSLGHYPTKYDDLIKYIHKDYVDEYFHRYIYNGEIANIDLVECFRGDWADLRTPSGGSFNHRLDILIILHRTSGLDARAIIIWYLIFVWTGGLFSEDAKDIADYVLKYADDPNFIN